MLVDAACCAYSLVSVPLYDTLGPDAVQYICNHAELAGIACSAAVLPTLLQCLHACPTVSLVVSPPCPRCDPGRCLYVRSPEHTSLDMGGTLPGIL